MATIRLPVVNVLAPITIVPPLINVAPDVATVNAAPSERVPFVTVRLLTLITPLVEVVPAVP